MSKNNEEEKLMDARYLHSTRVSSKDVQKRGIKRNKNKR